MQWTIREVLTWTTNRFKQADIDTALLDAQLLLCKVLNTQKINLYMDMDKPLSEAERTTLREFVKRRLAGEPVAYILKEKYWHNLKLLVDERVLIPRPETECLLDFILDTFKYYKQQPKLIYDFCTGSGCLAIALAVAFPSAKIVGIDISQDALALAKENANLNNVTSQIEWLNLDLTHTQSYVTLKEKYGPANIIVANPPYVSEAEWNNLDISVKNYEPKIALTTSENGLFIGKNIISNIENYSLLCPEFSVFGMEMAENHPQLLINENIKRYFFNSTLQEKKLNEYFGLCDLDNKCRFLCKLT